MKEAIQRLAEAGHVAYVVGGSVRDFLLGKDTKETKDHDIATSATPEEICALFPDAVTVGKAFGVIKVPTGTVPPLLEIATFRQDLAYKDYRRPEGVVFAGPLEDARRRDFTVNALFYDPKTSRILDLFGGIADLKAGVIRAIGNPDARFREDALRLLRAVRFAARFGFKLDPATTDAIKASAKLITRVSAERIRDELTGMLTGPRPAEALELLSRLGLLRLVLPEVERLKGVKQSPLSHPEGDVWAHTLKVMELLARQTPSRSSELAWASMLHDSGKPVSAARSGGKNFNGHELEGGKVAESIGLRLKMSRAEIDRIRILIEDHLKFKDAFQMRESTLQRFIRQPYFEELLALHKADAMASDGNLAYYEFCASMLEAYQRAPVEVPRLIDGKDLLQLGLKAGPEFSEILRRVEDLALEKKLHTKEEALEYVVKHFVK